MPEDYNLLQIHEGDNWEVFLHENQYFLGRVYLWAKRTDASDLMDMTQAEQQEFFDLGSRVKEALTSLFQPDLFNYAALSNNSPHLHVHFIPRYKTSREFAGQEFKDERWGKNYAPYDYDFKISEDKLLQVRDAIRKEMEKHGIC
ncbi:MAG: HIT family protein [Nanoarchaeota archaeon]|nr:HIT family protein [Nanoarchaeota archaeon]